MQKHHCEVYGPDLDGYSRVVAIWEILKLGYSVFNIDPDVVFFEEFPQHIYEADLSFAMYSQYTQLHSSLDDFETSSLYSSLNFGTWFWASNPRSMLAFASYYIVFMLDTQGSSARRFDYHTESEARNMLINAPQLCDDQMVFHRYLNRIRRQELIRQSLFGSEVRNESSSGVLAVRILTPAEMALAVTFFRSSDAERKSTFKAMHMSTYGSWKMYGMKDTGLWYVADEDLNSCDYISSVAENSLASLESIHQVRGVLETVLHVALLTNVTFRLPLLNCKLVQYADLVQAQRDFCEWFFQYSYSALESNGIHFVHNAHQVVSCNSSKSLYTVSAKSTVQGLVAELRAVYKQTQSTEIILIGDMEHLLRLDINPTNALQEAEREHGCC